MPLPSGLHAHYNETSIIKAGSTLTGYTDQSGNGHDGTILGSPVVESVFGIDVLRLNSGSTDYIRLPAAFSSGLSDATAIAVIEAKSGNTGSFAYNGHWLDTDTAGNSSHFGSDAEPGAWYDGYGGSARPKISSGVSIGTRYVASLRRSGSTIYGGLNGIEGAGQASAVAWKTNCTIGQNSAYEFDGQICEIAFYSSSLLPADIDDAVAFLTAKWITGPSPLNTVAPALTGTEIEGNSLTSTAGTWDSQGNGALSYVYQATESDDALGTNEQDIAGATALTYLLTASQVGKFIRWRIEATNDGGTTTAYSNFSGRISAADVPPPAAGWSAQQCSTLFEPQDTGRTVLFEHHAYQPSLLWSIDDE